MKSTGIVRRVDELGRVVIPKETRQVLSISERDSLEIFTDEDMILLKKYSPGCIFCNNVKNLTVYKNKHICEECSHDLKSK
ncbi:AbrB/MazE/SpoVT family DNA-binding domain-containing protein [Ruminiclostridium cellulolyticum]|uniref:Transcriptional regulator, AbrB family n=1 Tax=Ruminiclostridium cellulolyticum (strain ATCC 35319 / DSM 5812 / JCM 6584 / H10) TaxID=394503 RepID=B8I095_RUMCH|nr:AbrB/MazE/SpoVT family DNA-binding domain-containing protein [Ruminiclostridium cellulolyticum]ACL77421.1 transcriptional regulator, AbrB family [Ruminiclostridium cellulolyticum H10]